MCVCGVILLQYLALKLKHMRELFSDEGNICARVAVNICEMVATCLFSILTGDTNSDINTSAIKYSNVYIC